jgi:hypothetical protein
MTAKMIKNSTSKDANGKTPPNMSALLAQFIGNQQLSAIIHGLRGEESSFFKEKIRQIYDTIMMMPKTMQTDGQGDKAIAYLHYFGGDTDWYITECDDLHAAQSQAFGLVAGWCMERDYISISEIISTNKIELDLHWTPKPLHEILVSNKSENEEEFTSPGM